MSSSQGPANRLIHEASPYLLQHAHNPVNWYPWGAEALDKAKAEGKLIFVSIGYAACHWCHVMERESFESTTTAALLNRDFIAIKVDREERPDLDGHFMEILNTMTGSGGWPLNMFLTPDLQPVYGGTYFPPEPRYGRPSFNELLTSLQQQWSGDRVEMLKNLAELQSFLRQKLATPKIGQASKGAADPRLNLGSAVRSTHLTQPIDSPGETEEDLITNKVAATAPVSPDKSIDYAMHALPTTDPRLKSVEFWRERFDLEHGGFGTENKFPQPLILSMILRRSSTSKNLDIAEPVLLTLDKMAAGGVRDQLGGSFHRYSVDRYWQVPHFEIMLYDNALLARLYLEAFQLTNRSRYRFVVSQVLDDMLARFQLDGGCFISSIDADSDGEEGLYYTWTEEEVVAILAPEAAAEFLEDFVDPMEGTVEGRSVLRLLSDAESIDSLFAKHSASIKKLLALRQKRVPPAVDDKILASWNGLMVSALAKAGAVLQEPRYILAAQRCMSDLLEKSFVEGKPRHSRRGDIVGEVVFLDDYAFIIQALLDLYEANFDLAHLTKARELAGQMLERFQTAAGQPFPLTPKDQPSDLPVRVELEDGVTPAGHSSALVALQRLALFSSDERLEKAAKEHLDNLGGYLEENPFSSPELLWALDFNMESAKEVIISGPFMDTMTQQLLATVRQRFMSGLVLAVVDPAQPADPEQWPLLARPMLSEKPTAYVCKDLVCRLPVFTQKDLEKMLSGE